MVDDVNKAFEKCLLKDDLRYSRSLISKFDSVEVEIYYVDFVKLSNDSNDIKYDYDKNSIFNCKFSADYGTIFLPFNFKFSDIKVQKQIKINGVIEDSYQFSVSKFHIIYITFKLSVEGRKSF